MVARLSIRAASARTVYKEGDPANRLKSLIRCGSDLTGQAQLANCIPLVTSVVLTPGGLPGRLEALGWRKAVHVRGTLPGAQPSVAIVGARAATATGMARAHALARHLARRGVHLVSGGALGIDGAAHRGALAGGGTTTVVLGSGLDVPYPARHAAAVRGGDRARRGARSACCPTGRSRAGPRSRSATR